MSEIQSTKTGYWIPIEIGELTDLNWTEKVLLSEIEGFTKNNKPCFKSNQSFAEILQVDKKHVSKMITNLKNKGYITLQLTYKQNSKEVDKRYITPNCGFYIHKNMPKPLSANMIPPLLLNADTPLPLNADTPLPLNAEDTKTNVTKTIITKTTTISSKKNLKNSGDSKTKESDEKNLERKRRDRELYEFFKENIWERYPLQHRVGEKLCFSKLKSAIRNGSNQEEIIEGFNLYLKVIEVNKNRGCEQYIKRLDNWFAAESWKNPNKYFKSDSDKYYEKMANQQPRYGSQKRVEPSRHSIPAPEQGKKLIDITSVRAKLQIKAISELKCSVDEVWELSEAELKKKFTKAELSRMGIEQ